MGLVGTDRAAVHAAEAAELLERVEVTADGLGGDAEVAGEARDRDSADAVEGVDDLVMPLRCVQATPPWMRSAERPVAVDV